MLHFEMDDPHLSSPDHRIRQSAIRRLVFEFKNDKKMDTESFCSVLIRQSIDPVSVVRRFALKAMQTIFLNENENKDENKNKDVVKEDENRSDSDVGMEIFEIILSCAESALKDEFDDVRLSAMELVGSLGIFLNRKKIISEKVKFLINKSFLLVCSMSIDMIMRIRQKCFQILYHFEHVDEDIVFQNFSKKILNRSSFPNRPKIKNFENSENFEYFEKKEIKEKKESIMKEKVQKEKGKINQKKKRKGRKEEREKERKCYDDLRMLGGSKKEGGEEGGGEGEGGGGGGEEGEGEGEEDSNRENLIFLQKISAGAILTAMEDEFFEVRFAALRVLEKFCIENSKIFEFCFSAIMDCLNDEKLCVRNYAILSVWKLSKKYSLRWEDKDLHMLLGLLKDSNFEIQNLAKNVFSEIKFSSSIILLNCFLELLNNLERYPNDEINVLNCLINISKKNTSKIEILANQILQKAKKFSRAGTKIPEKKYFACLTLLMNATSETFCPYSIMSSDMLLDYRILKNKIQNLLKPPEKNMSSFDQEKKTSIPGQLSNFENSSLNRKNFEIEISEIEGNDFVQKRKKIKTNVENNKSDKENFEFEKKLNWNSGWEEGVKFETNLKMEDIFENNLKNLVENAFETNFLFSNGHFCKSLETIRNCMHILKNFISISKFSKIEIFDFYFRQFQCWELILEAKIFLNFFPATEKFSGCPKKNSFLEKLNSLVLKLKYLFLGIPERDILTFSEIQIFSSLVKMLTTENIFHEEKKLISKRFQKILDSKHFPDSDFFSRFKNNFASENLEIFRVLQHLKNFWPKIIFAPNHLFQIRAEIISPSENFLSPIIFFSGLPLEIFVQGKIFCLQNFSSKFFLQIGFPELPNWPKTFHSVNFLEKNVLNVQENVHDENFEKNVISIFGNVVIWNLPNVSHLVAELNVMMKCSDDVDNGVVNGDDGEFENTHLRLCNPKNFHLIRYDK